MITGKNSNNNLFLPVSGFELYGTVFTKNPRDQRQEPQPSNENRPSNRNKSHVAHFEYESDFDKNGIFYYLGTNGGRYEWKNPASINMVTVTSSPLGTKPTSAPAYSIVGRSIVRCVTTQTLNAYFMVVLNHGFRARVNRYTLRHYRSWNSEVSFRCSEFDI